ncbi:MAG TPA: diguanylate cyclase [Candidatus Acidoferrales bacterium]|jgi:diguanylate cyclase (GGDEF)-like protein/PAS domain S-box-containing protein|nr:diguanylate cyclase [Candidatus Acidoferrales bacterium]
MTKDPSTDAPRSERPLRILLVEDDEVDVALCLLELRKARINFQCNVASSLEEFSKKVSTEEYDLILSDYRFRGWTGMDAFALVLKQEKHTPFILVTGLLGDEVAVECLRNGVDDYILKEHLDRLPLAINRVLRESEAIELRISAEAALRESEAKFRKLAEATNSLMLIYQGTECKYANRAAEIVTGYTQEELLAASSWEIIHPDSRDVLVEQGLTHLQGDRAPKRFEIKILTKEGVAKWLELTIVLIELDAKPAGLFTGFEITGRKYAEDEIRRLMASDPLTGLFNLRRLKEGFDQEVKRSTRNLRSFAMVCLDLDGLKSINDAHGHLTGSRALCRVANVLRSQCRSIDILSRNGGDEFVLILPDTPAAGAHQLARRICRRLSTDGQQPALTLSLGIAVFPEDGETYEELFNAADRALYKMKQQGGGKLLLCNVGDVTIQ